MGLATGIKRTWWGRLGTVLLLGAAVFIGVAAGAELIEIPLWSYVLMLGAWGIDWLVALGLGAVFVAFAFYRRRTLARLLSLILLLVSVLITGFVGWQQVSFARAAGTSIDALALTGIGQSGSKPNLQPIFLQDERSGQQLRAGIWLPQQRGADAATTKAPAGTADPQGAGIVVLIHGGGWSNGNRLNPMTRGQAAWFAQQGYLAIALDYPLSSENLPTWQLAEDRLSCGLAWIGQHASAYGGDPSRLALVGDSAGGNLALDIAYRQALDTLTPSADCGGVVPQIAAVSTTYPIADPVSFYNNADLLMAPKTAARARLYTGGTPSQVPSRYTEISPLAKVNAALQAGVGDRLPPTLIVQGSRDHVVPTSGNRELDAALKAASARHQTVFMPYADHVFDLNPGSAASQMWRHLTLELFASVGI